MKNSVNIKKLYKETLYIYIFIYLFIYLYVIMFG